MRRSAAVPGGLKPLPAPPGALGEDEIAPMEQRPGFARALKLYRLDNGRYPTTEQGLRALVEKPAVDPVPSNWKAGGYLDAATVRKDPWGNDYQYLNPGLHGEIDVLSFGRDGQPGGEGPDADIGSWSL